MIMTQYTVYIHSCIEKMKVLKHAAAIGKIDLISHLIK